MARPTRKKINKRVENLNKAINPLVLTDIYRLFHPKQQKIHTSQLHKEHF